MLASFTHEPDDIIPAPGKEPIIEDLLFWLKAIALNVLSGAAFNLQIPWPTKSVVGFNALREPVEPDTDSDSGFPAEEKNHLMSWQYCMNQIMDNFYFLIGLSEWQLKYSPWKFMRELPAAYDEFMEYIDEMIDDAGSDDDETDTSGENTRASSENGEDTIHTPDKGTSASSDIEDDTVSVPEKGTRASSDKGEDTIQIPEKTTKTSPDSVEDTAHTTQKSTSTLLRRNDLLSNIMRANNNDLLDDSEIFGNICILLIAGHETSASVLETAIILLATEPDFQQNIQDEIDNIWAGKKPEEDLTYEDYPKMRTIMALMLETLRLYPPIINLFKSTTTKPQVLTYRSQPLPLPPDTDIFLEAVSLHRNPKYWSPSSDTFIPSRWLKDSTYTLPPNALSESPAHANLLCPQKGSYIPFGAGMRSCLGKKFAQVEFCTIIAVLLRECSVELVDDEKGEVWEEKRKEALECLDRRRTIIALRMLGKVKVRFVRRGAESFPPRKGKTTG